MPIVRVYLPLDAAALDHLRSAGELGPAPIPAHAATPATSRAGLGNDEEEREYAAWSAAADDAGSRAAQGRRRVIASADVDAAIVRRLADGESDDSEPASSTSASGSASGGAAPALTAVEVDGAVALPRIASFHIDEEPGGEIADLLWYDVTELDDVITLVTS